MFERLCELLLQLYPTAFRHAYGLDAEHLIRDRARHERGVFRRLRLLTDLAADLFMTSLRGWHPVEPLLTSSQGGPHFVIIDVQGPRPAALAAGALTSILMIAAFLLLFEAKAPPIAGELASGTASAAIPPATPSGPDRPAVGLAADPHHALISAIAATLEARYTDRAIGRQLADALRAYDADGAYESLGMGADLATRINTHILAASRALGVARGAFVADVLYSAQPLPSGPPPPLTEEMRERNRNAILRQNCLFETTEMLPRDVGYVKVNGFADASTCRETTAAVMARLNRAAALIIDLRDNAGGFGETALQIAGYLFDRPTLMYDPRPDSPVPARTASPISGNRLADRPVFVLTSSRTQSAAEYVVYNLKMLRRATIVGETTAGRQHSGAFHRLTDHFGLGIQEAAPPANPYPVAGWEIIGVEPDVRIASGEALEAARRLAEHQALPRR